MSYDLKLFRKEVRRQYDNLDFLDDEDSVIPFTEEQITRLRKRLDHYQYQVESESDGLTVYHFKGGQSGITAYLTKNCLTFQCAGGGQDGIFEILQTSDEFSDSEFLTLNLQEGKWSGMSLGDEEQADNVVSKNSQANADKQLNTSGKRPWWRFW